MADQRSHRLPSTVTPERYQIRLTPDLTTWTFTGEECVSVKIHAPAREVVLNAAELEFHAVTATGANGKTIGGTVTLDSENEQAVFTFPEPLAAGNLKLEIKFSGILNDKLHGFYRSTYKDAGGNYKPLASTQFESTDARRAFPCWDE
ncbi:MAG TPA: M1 family peptidase, partial [Candidatus Binatia bacterium]